MREDSSLFPLLEKFIKFEKENDLFSIEIKGYKFWDYIRYSIFQRLIDYRVGFVAIEKKGFHRYIRGFWDVMRSLFYILVYTLKKKRKYEIVFINTSIKKYNFEGEKVDYYTFPLIQQLFKKYSILLIDPDEIINGKIGGTHYCDVLWLRPFNLIDRIKSFLVFYNPKERKIFFEINEKINREFKAKININNIRREVYSYQLQRIKRFDRIFNNCKPQLVIYADNGWVKPVIESAHKYGIITVDLQHSLVSPLNILYNYPEGIKKDNFTTFSDYIFTFGDFWNNEFRLPVKKISVGFPFFERERKKVNKKMPLEKCEKHRDKNIIILSVLRSKDALVKVACDLTKLLPEYNIFYKLRPDEYQNWQEQYPQEFMKNQNITVIDNNQISLYEYFQICRYQIGTNTTTLYEGLHFGLITFVLKSGWYEEMKPLYDNGYAFLVSGAEEIAKKIKNSFIPPRKLNVEDIFKSDSLQNMENTIECVMRKKGN